MAKEKNFAPSEKRKRKAWQTGDVAKSREITGVCVLATAVFWLSFSLPSAFTLLGHIFTITEAENQDFHTNTMIVSDSYVLVGAGVYLALGLALLMFSVMVSELAQGRLRGVGVNNLLRWQRLNVVEGVKRVFQKQTLLDALRSFVVWGIGVVLVLCTLLPLLVWEGGFGDDLEHDLPILVVSFLKPLWSRLLCLGIFAAGIDLFLVQSSWKRRNSMDREELREEMKESEGNPEVRGMRRQLHLEMLAQGEIQAVRRARLLFVRTTQPK